MGWASCSDEDAFSSSDSGSFNSSSTDHSDIAIGCLKKSYDETFAAFEDNKIEFGRRPTIKDFNDAECLANFRFRKQELFKLADMLYPRLLPFLSFANSGCVIVDNRYTSPYETCLLVLLFRLSYPHRISPDMEKFFGMRKSHISATLITFGESMCCLSKPYLTNLSIWQQRIPLYSQLIRSKLGVLDARNIWGFLDATIRPTCRPLYYQQTIYTRYKRCHGLKFQSIVTPDGMIASLLGPFSSKTHDARIFRESGLFDRLREMMPVGVGEAVYCLYADSAYALSAWIMHGYINPQANSPEADFNVRMSSARIAVEWGYKNVTQLWQFLDFRRQMMVFKTPVAQLYIVAAFLTNLRCCFYGNQQSDYFGATRMSVEEYLSLVDGVGQQDPQQGAGI